MLRTLNILLQIQIITLANGLIYYWRKLPWIGSFLSDGIYTHHGMKRFMTSLAKILIILWGFGSKFAYVGLLIYVPVLVLGEAWSTDMMLQQFTHVFVIISFLVAGVSSAKILEPKRSKYVAVKLMRMSPAHYMKVTLSYRYGSFFICFLPAMLWFGIRLGASLPQILLLTLAVTLWRVCCEYWHLLLFEKTGHILIKQAGIGWTVILVGYAAAYIPLLTEWPSWIGAGMLSWPIPLAIAILGLWSAFRLSRYPDYRAVVDAATKRDDPLLDLGRVFQEANQASVRSKDSDYILQENEVDRLSSLQGYAYLNALFFARHRSLVRRPIFVRFMIIGVLCLLGIGVVLTVEQVADFLLTNLGTKLPILFFVMLSISVGEQICKAMFHHCDLSLMRYSFYRQSAFQHFQIRLIKIAQRNLLIASALAAVLSILYAVAGGNILHPDVFMLWTVAAALSIFFSVHHLLMYYMLQPYTVDLNIKNPLYYLIYYVISAMGGFGLFVSIPSWLFALIMMLVTSLYLTLALILVHRFGSRTFRVR